MRLFSSAIAQRLAQQARPELLANPETAKEIAEERDNLLKKSDAIVIFLFTALSILAIIVFGFHDGVEKLVVPVLGLTIRDPLVFCFILFAIGNVVYTVHHGLFLKIFILEYFLLFVITDPDFKGSRVVAGLLRSYHANIYEFIRFNKTLERANFFPRIVFGFSRIYTRYIFIILYAIYYYTVLVFFLVQLFNSTDIVHKAMFWILSAMNLLTIFTSFTIFLPYKAGIKSNRTDLLVSDAQGPRRESHDKNEKPEK